MSNIDSTAAYTALCERNGISMNEITYRFVIRGIKVPLKPEWLKAEDYDNAAFSAAAKILKCSAFFGRLTNPKFAVYKKSVDARKRNELLFVYSVMFEYGAGFRIKNDAALVSACEKEGIEIVPNSPFDFPEAHSDYRPVIVGFGPCGMFASLVLAKAGLRPIVLERGADVDTRQKAVDAYWSKGELDTETNVQFGEGGAGTFSDGKLLTRINDPLCAFVLETFHKHGANDDILTNAKPHIGTDKLRLIVKSIRREAEACGAEIRFNTRLDGCSFDSSGRIASLTVNGEKNAVSTDALFLCMGHSARDTFGKLYSNGIDIVPKPFSVGVRIEHLQSKIDEALYGESVGHPALPKGEYALSHRDGDRAVYTFCMCPGGTVVASSSEKDGIVTNGMSCYARDGINANSAVAVSVGLDDLERRDDPFSAMDFQRRIEASAFDLAHGGAPVMTVGDFLGKGASAGINVTPTYTGRTENRDIRKVFPPFVSDMLKEGILRFEKKIRGFSDAGAMLTAPETRTSSPVRMPRGELRTAEKYPCVYPCGEGAGYAGGITSAAVDGIKTALAYIENLKR